MKPTEGERVVDFLNSTFYNIQRNGFKILGLHVNLLDSQLTSGNYKIEFIIDNDQELIENEHKKVTEEIGN